MIDDELKEILKGSKSVPIKGSEVYKNGEITGMMFRQARLTNSEAIAQIKQAFADYGYIPVAKLKATKKRVGYDRRRV